MLGQRLFVGFGIGEEGAIDEALAVAYHPYLAPQSAIDNGAGGESFFGMEGQPRQVFALVVASEGGGCEGEKLVQGALFGHTANDAANELHGITPVGADEAISEVCLAGASVNHGDEIGGDHYTVLALAVRTFGHHCLFYYFDHGVWLVWRAISC